MTVPKEIPFCPALLVGRREEPTHSYQPSVQLVLLLILRSVPQELVGKIGRARPWGCVWDQGHWGGGPQVFHLHTFVLLRGEAWISPVLAFPCAPPLPYLLILGIGWFIYPLSEVSSL